MDLDNLQTSIRHIPNTGRGQGDRGHSPWSQQSKLCFSSGTKELRVNCPQKWHYRALSSPTDQWCWWWWRAKRNKQRLVFVLSSTHSTLHASAHCPLPTGLNNYLNWQDFNPGWQTALIGGNVGCHGSWVVNIIVLFLTGNKVKYNPVWSQAWYSGRLWSLDYSRV